MSTVYSPCTRSVCQYRKSDTNASLVFRMSTVYTPCTRSICQYRKSDTNASLVVRMSTVYTPCTRSIDQHRKKWLHASLIFHLSTIYTPCTRSIYQHRKREREKKKTALPTWFTTCLQSSTCTQRCIGGTGSATQTSLILCIYSLALVQEVAYQCREGVGWTLVDWWHHLSDQSAFIFIRVLILILVSVPTPCYRSSMWKIPVILPKVQVAGYS